ncbi:MAG TPA: hypothetical protein VJP76_06425, partial [Candidatus Tumulicola sp.]|nr:hypothetical protein [Candidatus Tumulicola sp.]
MNAPSFEDDPRTRVVRRLRQAAEYRIVVLLAAAGFGKSIALRQFLETLDGSARVDVTPGMKAADFAARLSAVLNADTCATVAVDGLEGLAEPDEAVAKLVESIERTKAQRRWVISTRSAAGLPLGTWIAYRDCELVIGGADLQYARDEIVEAGLRLGFGLGDEEIDDIAALTEGWPLAVGVALRAALHGHGRDRLQAEVREAASRFYRETVYPRLTGDERSLLAVAAALPEIDVRILELAGLPRANETLEKLRERTTLLADGPDGTYHCLGLFRSFLRRQCELGGSGEIGRVYLSAARGLEAAGRVNDALDAFINAKAQSDVLRLLEQSGFDLLERGQSSAIGRAVDVLSEPDRRLNPHVLALRGVLQSLAGDVISAEALLRRALGGAQNLPRLTSAVSIRLALILTNQGREIDELLKPVANDVARSAADRAEAWSLMAARSALAGSPT